uniref:Uncharacterized protein n=1 Tax=Talaromyces marneffei PM1 TaxID=1077442 RepID=A0A093VTT3_TALMA
MAIPKMERFSVLQLASATPWPTHLRTSELTYRYYAFAKKFVGFYQTADMEEGNSAFNVLVTRWPHVADMLVEWAIYQKGTADRYYREGNFDTGLNFWSVPANHFWDVAGYGHWPLLKAAGGKAFEDTGTGLLFLLNGNRVQAMIKLTEIAEPYDLEQNIKGSKAAIGNVDKKLAGNLIKAADEATPGNTTIEREMAAIRTDQSRSEQEFSR